MQLKTLVSSIMTIWAINATVYKQSVINNTNATDLSIEAYTDRDRHTSTYSKYWPVYGNNNSFFYDSDTFGHIISADPCTQFTDNRQFRAYVNNLLVCNSTTKAWCVSDAYKCTLGKNRQCYNVEHIIDLNGPEFVGYNKNIFANVVMAYGQWNQELGRLAYKDYDANVNEKTIVYGQATIDTARQYIEKCHDLNYANVNANNNKLTNFQIMEIVFYCISLVSTIGYIAFMIYNKCKAIRPIYQSANLNDTISNV